MIIKQFIGVGVLMTIYLVPLAQDFYPQINVATKIAALQGADDPEQKAIIVDTSSKKKSFPSMEEEMSMYVELKSKEPKAYFFPNPSDGIVWIEHNLGKETDLLISDMSGEVIFTAENLNATKLDLSTFKSGDYSISLTNGAQEVSRRLYVK